MSKLKGVAPNTALRRKPKIIIFGGSGVKKTWVSLDFPSTYYIDCEGGASEPAYQEKLDKSGGTYFGVEHGSRNFNAVIEEIKALATEKHHFKTLVIDSFTKLYNIAAFEAGEKFGDDYGRDKKEANKPTKKLLDWLDRIDMNVILVCHEIAEWGVDAKGNRVEISKTFDGYPKLEYELNLCLRILDAGGKSIARVRKNRLDGFVGVASFPWAYEEFAVRYGKDIIEGEVLPISLATRQQLQELDTLLKKAFLPSEDTKTKWLSAAKVESFEDMDTEKLQAIIDLINNKYLPKGE